VQLGKDQTHKLNQFNLSVILNKVPLDVLSKLNNQVTKSYETQLLQRKNKDFDCKNAMSLEIGA
jgi:hypothetical protein